MSESTRDLLRDIVSFHFWEARFRWKRLQVCLWCWLHLGHWPINDLTDAEWRSQLDGVTAYEAFVEGWCRE